MESMLPLGGVRWQCFRTGQGARRAGVAGDLAQSDKYARAPVGASAT